ncbi:MAG: winged helix-turn-helix transcriptional regulator [Promethearchaeota archaeon]
MMQDQIKKDEQIVFNLIEEYLNNNRYLNSKDLISFINSRFARSSINISNNGIKEILNTLFKKKVIVERSKFTKKDVLFNYNRKLIYELIKKKPGIHFNKIGKILNMNNSMVAWHLNILLNFQYIKKKKN